MGASPPVSARPALETRSLRGSAVVNSSAYSTDQWAMYQQPVDMTIGDFDGDGGLELAVLHRTYQSLTPNPVGVVTLSIMQWNGTAATPWQKVCTNENGSDRRYAGHECLVRGQQRRTPRFHDMHLAAGLFKFEPELGYSLNRRQLAVAWTQPQRCFTCDETAYDGALGSRLAQLAGRHSAVPVDPDTLRQLER